MPYYNLYFLSLSSILPLSSQYNRDPARLIILYYSPSTVLDNLSIVLDNLSIVLDNLSIIASLIDFNYPT